MSSATLLLGIFACLLTPAAASFLLPNIQCKQGSMVFSINPNSSLFGPKDIYDVEIEDTQVTHDTSCPKWGAKGIPGLKVTTYSLTYKDCKFNFSRIYHASNDYTTIYFNHKFLARSVNAITLKRIPGTPDISFMAGCWYQVEGNVNTSMGISGNNSGNGQGTVSASEDIDMWITDHQQNNITKPVAYGTPLTLHMALNSKGRKDYTNIAPKFCNVAPVFGGSNPVPFVESYHWDGPIFDNLEALQSIERRNTNYGRPGHPFYYYTYMMNFTAFTFDNAKALESVNFYCVFLLCLNSTNAGDCNKKEEAKPYISPSDHARRKRSVPLVFKAGRKMVLEKSGSGSLYSHQAVYDVVGSPNTGGDGPSDYFWLILWILLALFLLSLLCCCCFCMWRYFLEPLGERRRAHSHCHDHCHSAPAPQPMILPVPISVPPSQPSVAYSVGQPPSDAKVAAYLQGLEASENASSQRSLVHSSSASSKGLRRMYRY